MFNLIDEPEPEPICIGCGSIPENLDEYAVPAREEGISPAEYVRTQEGTYNPRNGHFLCTACYVRTGAPSSPNGWRAP